MKAVLRSVKPYWIFKIIALAMGWAIDGKTVEVGKDYPKAADWNKRTYIYCSKDKKSFKRIPKRYRHLMEALLGKVVGEFVCDKIETYKFCKPYDYYVYDISDHSFVQTGLRFFSELEDYGKGKPLYGWRISELKIYDKPKEISEFKAPSKCPENIDCCVCKYYDSWGKDCMEDTRLTRPFQSWGYVEEL